MRPPSRTRWTVFSLTLGLLVVGVSAGKARNVTSSNPAPRPLKLGQPIELRFNESAKEAGGLTLTFTGITNAVPENGPEILRVGATLKDGNAEEHLTFGKVGETLSWRGWAVTLGPFKFSYTEVNTASFVVRRASPKKQ